MMKPVNQQSPPRRRHVHDSKTSDAGAMLRNGHVLTLSSLIGAGLGGVFWILATAWYSPQIVGQAYAAISMMMLLAGIGQLNMADVLIRFLSQAGRDTACILRRAYGVSGLCSALSAGVFLWLVPYVAPQLHILHEPWMGAGFIAATVAYAWFAVQNGALTGLRLPVAVTAATGALALMRLCTLILLTWLGGGGAILPAWTLAMALVVPALWLWLAKRTNPGQTQLSAPQPSRAPAAFADYAAWDYAGALCTLAAVTVVPLLVLNEKGSQANAYFSIGWVISYALYLLAINMCSSLIVEGMRRPEELVRQAWRLLRHCGLLLGAAVAALCAIAPLVLTVFGPDYASQTAPALRLLALSALPHLVVQVAIAAGRVRRTMAFVVGVQAAVASIALVGAGLLLPRWGITGVGVAWLVAQSVVAGALLITHTRWLPAARRVPQVAAHPGEVL